MSNASVTMPKNREEPGRHVKSLAKFLTKAGGQEARRGPGRCQMVQGHARALSQVVRTRCPNLCKWGKNFRPIRHKGNPCSMEYLSAQVGHFDKDNSAGAHALPKPSLSTIWDQPGQKIFSVQKFTWQAGRPGLERAWATPVCRMGIIWSKNKYFLSHISKGRWIGVA